MNLDKLISAINNIETSKKPIIIGIEGFGGSGKTTIACKLKDILIDSYIISIDDFIVKEKLHEESWDKGTFDRGRLEKEVLIPARLNKTIMYRKLIWEDNKLSQPITLPEVTYLIVEGISCYHPDITKYYDFKIWVDVPIGLTKERGHARDGSNENANMWDLWSANDLRYEEKYHPELVADLIIDNSNKLD